jgi:L-seryl-tRNA(Ser) seleniumtransferase
MKRRDAIRNLSVLPVTGVVLGSSVPFESVMAAPAHLLLRNRNLFRELGIRTFIKAAGTYTAMSGCIMHEEVIDTIRATAGEYAMIDEVQDKVGERIAALCHAEAATVTAGCWSALVLGTAGVLTGTDMKKVAQLPHLEEMKSEVLVQKAHNHGYVHALTNTGVKIVEVETAEDVEKAAGPNTAMMWFLNYAGPDGKINDKEGGCPGKKLNIPTIVIWLPMLYALESVEFTTWDLICLYPGGKD